MSSKKLRWQPIAVIENRLYKIMGIPVYATKKEFLEGFGKIAYKLGVLSEGLRVVEQDKSKYSPLVDVKKHADTTSKKPFIMGELHSLATLFSREDVDFIHFDKHSDDQLPINWELADIILDPKLDLERKIAMSHGFKYVYNCNFLAYMHRNNQYVVGKTIHENGLFVKKTFDPQNAEAILNEPLKSKVFIYLDIDVLDPKYTKAHLYVKWWPETLAKMTPEQLKSIIAAIASTREIVGVGVASYLPSLDDKDYETAYLIADILSPIFQQD